VAEGRHLLMADPAIDLDRAIRAVVT